jgi:hypothetical protein
MGRWHRAAVTEGYCSPAALPLRHAPAARATSPLLRNGEGRKLRALPSVAQRPRAHAREPQVLRSEAREIAPRTCPRRRARKPKTSGGHHKPGSVSSGGIPCGTGLRWQPFIWAVGCPAALAANPGLSGRNTPALLAKGARPLFGLAPGGVCHAVAVASPPVRFYRTLSPLPVPSCEEPSAVCSLWHFPLRPRRNAGGRYPPPLFRGARTFLASCDTRLPQAP